jgi:spermidine/putrescine transport system substrate-binding protein
MKRHLRSLILVGAAALAAASCSQPQKELNLFAWSEYVPQAVLDQFTAETGIKVNYETYDSNEEMLSKLLGGAANYDLIQPSEYVIESLAKNGKLLELDATKVPNLKNIGNEYRNWAHDPGLKYSVPYMAGTVGIVVNTDKVKEPVKGYKDVFSGKYADRIATLDDDRELLTWALASLGADINQIDAAALAKARPVLASWLPQIKLFDSASPKTAFLNGEVDVGIVWSGEGAILVNEDPKFTYALPEEGAHMFIDSLAIPADAPNVDHAHAFLDFILRPEISKMISEEFPYTNPNVEARKLLSEAEQKNPASYPPGNPRLETFRDVGTAAADIAKLLTDLKAGM